MPQDPGRVFIYSVLQPFGEGTFCQGRFFSMKPWVATPGVEVNCRSGYRLQGTGLRLHVETFQIWDLLGLSNLFLAALAVGIGSSGGWVSVLEEIFYF